MYSQLDFCRRDLVAGKATVEGHIPIDVLVCTPLAVVKAKLRLVWELSATSTKLGCLRNLWGTSLPSQMACLEAR